LLLVAISKALSFVDQGGGTADIVVSWTLLFCFLDLLLEDLIENLELSIVKLKDHDLVAI